MALKDVKGKDTKISRSFKDVGMSFSRNRFTDDASSVKNDNAIKQSIKNLVLTAPGEKPFNFAVGSRVSQLLFEPLDPFTCDAIQEEIINTISQYEPRVSLTDVQAVAFEQGNKLAVTVEYTIVGQPIVESINFVLQRPE
tara:strand:+ start:409 stop:828 length:420 start_codon:yes stop_codon:yes gene_type:complete